MVCVRRRAANSGCFATSVVPPISFSCRATSTPSLVMTRSGSMIVGAFLDRQAVRLKGMFGPLAAGAPVSNDEDIGQVHLLIRAPEFNAGAVYRRPKLEAPRSWSLEPAVRRQRLPRRCQNREARFMGRHQGIRARNPGRSPLLLPPPQSARNDVGWAANATPMANTAAADHHHFTTIHALPLRLKQAMRRVGMRRSMTSMRRVGMRRIHDEACGGLVCGYP